MARRAKCRCEGEMLRYAHSAPLLSTRRHHMSEPRPENRRRVEPTRAPAVSRLADLNGDVFGCRDWYTSTPDRSYPTAVCCRYGGHDSDHRAHSLRTGRLDRWRSC